MTTIPNWLADRLLDVARGIPTDLLFEQNPDGDGDGEGGADHILLEADAATGVLDLGERWYVLNTGDPGENGANQATGLEPYPVQVHQIQSFTLEGAPDGGTFSVVDDSANESDPIAYDAGALDLQSALEALDDIGPGNVICYGGQLDEAPIYCVYVRDLGMQEAPGVALEDNDLTNGSDPTVTIAVEQIGAALFTAYVDADSGAERESETSDELVLGNATAGETVTHQSLLTGEEGDFVIGGALTQEESYSNGAPVSVPAGNVRLFSRGAA